jgi:hypothetical protein
MFKKMFLILIVIIVTCSCKLNNLSEEKKIYNEMIKKSYSINSQSSMDIPFDINIYINRISDYEIMYQIIIDNPIEEINNLMGIAIHNYETEDIYPNIGIFDGKVNLYPNYIDIPNNYVKGINLIGYIPYEEDLNDFAGEFKILINYKNQNGLNKEIYYICNK